MKKVQKRKGGTITAAFALAIMLSSFSCQSARTIEAEMDAEAEYVPDIETVSEERAEAILDEAANIDALAFKEIWGYVMEGREGEFSAKYPITDVGYFVSAVNVYSEMPPVPPKSKFFKNFKGRVHVVTSVDSQSQTHLLLSPDLPLRERIAEQMVKAAETYDGLQIDWENIPKKDAENFFELLRIVRKKLPAGKTLSIATKARLRTLADDPFAYAPLAELTDKIIIMAYDEHWSTSRPGAIASTGWGKRIASYAQTQIPADKLIMGLSFYGRTWLSAPVRGQAWYNSGIERIKRENGVTEVQRDAYGIPHFSFKEEATITGWYDDIDSLKIRCDAYAKLGIDRIAFWRVGQENPDFWKCLRISAEKE